MGNGAIKSLCWEHGTPAVVMIEVYAVFQLNQ